MKVDEVTVLNDLVNSISKGRSENSSEFPFTLYQTVISQ